MDRRSYEDAPRKRWLKKLNKTGESVQNKGKKLQLPVRFESSTLEIITALSNRNGISKAEVVRRMVGLGLRQTGEEY